MTLRIPLPLAADSYISSFPFQYPPDMDGMYSHLLARYGDYGETVHVGLQYLLKEYLSQRVTHADVDEAAEFHASHGPSFAAERWRSLVQKHDGVLPLLIKSVPEGTILPTGVMPVTVEATDPEFFWLAEQIETMLVRGIWYPSTVATRSLFAKKVIWEYLKESSDDPKAELPYKLHDFGGRGATTREAACVGGFGHLCNFEGSDTMEAIYFARKYYGAPMAARSIDAGAHCTVTSWGKEREIDYYRHMIHTFKHKGVFAVPCDTYDLMNAIGNMWFGALKDEMIESGATVVLRLDSGHPPTVVHEVLRLAEDKLGLAKNLVGYKVLPKWVRFIQGDGLDDQNSLRDIYEPMKPSGYSATNLFFGMGGGLLQRLNRDTQGFAFKVSEVKRRGVPHKVSKAPKGDSLKHSRAGRFSTVFRSGQWSSVEGHQYDDSLLPVWRNGELLREVTLEDIRKITCKEFR